MARSWPLPNRSNRPYGRLGDSCTISQRTQDDEEQAVGRLSFDETAQGAGLLPVVEDDLNGLVLGHGHAHSASKGCRHRTNSVPPLKLPARTPSRKGRQNWIP